jgi:hypothetical protein
MLKEDTAKKEEKLAALLKEAEDSPIVKQLRTEKAAATLATRMEAAGKIEGLKKERDEVIPILIEDRDAKEAKYKEAKAALDAAGGEYQTARGAVSGRSQSFDNAISRQETILLETADPAIDEAITFFRKKLDWLREPGRISRDARGAEVNIFTETVTRTTASNVPAIHSALNYCQAAIKALEQMKLCPELDVGKIEELKGNIPRIDVYTEFSGEKPVGRTIAGVNPRMLLPSDSQMDWEIAKVNERYKEIMRR